LSPDPSVKKVLIYRLGSLGDTTVALPCFHLIERSFPNAERVLLTNFPIHAKAPASAAVLGDSGLVHSYMRYTVGTRNPRELLQLASEIRRFKPEVLVYLMPVRPLPAVRRDKWFFRLAAGVKHIIGLPGPAELARVQDPMTGLYESEASRLARTVLALGDAATGDLANWNLRLTADEREIARNSLEGLAGKPLIVCGPGTKMQAKDWGQENWRALLGRLSISYPGYGLALIGAREDAEVSDVAARDWAGPGVNLCGKLSPRQTAAVFEHAAVFLGPDSGPMHLAACAGVPCVIAFSARGLPGVWYPAGSRHRIIYHQVNCFGCNLETCVAEARKCLTSITVEEMAAAVASVLS
jgi:heptosyltransferase III